MISYPNQQQTLYQSICCKVWGGPVVNSLPLSGQRLLEEIHRSHIRGAKLLSSSYNSLEKG